MGDLGEAGRLWLPLQEIERGGVEPLPGFDACPKAAVFGSFG